jgi:hypothetical protein
MLVDRHGGWKKIPGGWGGHPPMEYQMTIHSLPMNTIRHTISFLLLGLLVNLDGVLPATAQITPAPPAPAAPRYGEPQVRRYRVGASIHAKKGAVQKIRAMVAVPYACEQQQVEIIDEDISEQIDDLDYRELRGGGVRQMLISIDHLPAKEEAHAIITYEVQTRPILPPLETDDLRIPQKASRELKQFLGKSPYIEVGHRKIRAAVKEALENLDETATDWQQVEALYDYGQKTIDYLEGPDKSAVKALKDRQGDCQAISALFVAMCRTEKIPARIVWVHEHNYAEFYLEEASPVEASLTETDSIDSAQSSASDSAEGEQDRDRSKSKEKPARSKRRSKKAAAIGHWYPCESSGRRAFGEMPLARTVLQRGDNFRVPERPRERLRYASDFLIGLPTPGGGKPSVNYIREQF